MNPAPPPYEEEYKQQHAPLVSAPPQNQPHYTYPPPNHPGYPQTTQPGYPPTSQHMQPGPPYTTTTIITQPQVVGVVQFNEFPLSITCPHCHTQVVTALSYEPGTLVWVLFLIMFVTGLWICCFIPFCVDSCKDVRHGCPRCNNTLGTYRRM